MRSNSRRSAVDIIPFEELNEDDNNQLFWFPCRCGNNFVAKRESLEEGEEWMQCLGCSLWLKIIFEE